MEYFIYAQVIAVMDPEAELLAVACILFHFLKFTVVEAELVVGGNLHSLHFLKLSVGSANFRRPQPA